MKTKIESWQTKLENTLDARGLDADIDMMRVGNLEMVCRATFEALHDNTKAIPSCVRVYSKAFPSKPCTVCGDSVDLMAQFTDSGVCGKCARIAHRKAIA